MTPNKLKVQAVAELQQPYPGPNVVVLTNYQGKMNYRRAIKAKSINGSVQVTFLDGVVINYARTDYITVQE